MSGGSVPSALLKGVAYFLFAAALFIVGYTLVRGSDDMLMNFILAGFLVTAGGGLLAAGRARPLD